MTKEELEIAIAKMSGFVHYDSSLRLYQIMLDDISLWFSKAQITAIDEQALNTMIAKKIVMQLKYGDYPKEIYLN